MALKQTLALITLLVSGTSCFGQVSISPQAPTVLDTVYIKVPASAIAHWNPAGTNISMTSNKITVALGTIDLAPLPGGFDTPLNWPVGPLPAGAYQVEVKYDQTVLGTSQFTVLPRPDRSVGCTVRPCGPLWNHTDMWWNPAESGWGASIVQHSSGNIFGVFFFYADNGTATWYVLPGGGWTPENEFHGDVYQTRGPQLEAFDPHSVNVSLAGSATLKFSDSDPDQATLSLTIAGKTIQKSIQRQSY